MAAASLSAAGHPQAVAASRHAFAVTPEQEFSQGLAFLVDGLGASPDDRWPTALPVRTSGPGR
jgi:hypothetical protein